MGTKYFVKNAGITVVVLSLSFLACILLEKLLDVQEHITAVFCFSVFLISLLTDGYIYGIIAAFVSVLAVNYAFTFPYFAFNFTITVNLLSAIVMIIIAMLTSTLTTKIKIHESMKAESETERMRANLLRAVSHDLRTPLTTIYGSCTTLLESKSALNTQQQETLLKSIKEDSLWLIRMVENLLSITRIGSGQVRILKTPTVLEELIDSAITKFHKSFPEQEVKVEIPYEIVVIPMDAILIEQVIINLLNNAVEHAYNMTQLLLRVTIQQKKAVFEISDDGIGIMPDRIANAFSGRHDNKEIPADAQRSNSGIGLSVCATIIHAHGGEISAENAKSGGAVFRFALSTEDAVSE